MKQIEITTRVNNSLKEIDKILKKQGFKKIRQSRIEDKYMYASNIKLNKKNIIDILRKSVLVRYLCVNKKEEFKKITYKNKVYKNDVVISEEKINVNIDDTSKAIRLFESLSFNTLVDVKYDAIVYSNDKIELCFQDVENLGVLLEVENEKDFDGICEEEIINEKKNMLHDISKFGLDITNEYDVKKAYELIYNNLK